MKTILVTGVAGFIGSSIAERLLKDGYKVIGIDNLSTGTTQNLPVNKRFKFYKLDLTNYEALTTLLIDNPVDVVMHLAGNASIVNAMSNPVSDVKNNIIATMNMVNASIEHRIPRFLHASTMVVYGADNVNKKETDCCVPTSTYGVTKYAGERFVMNASSRTDLLSDFNATAFRMFNVYGPKQDLRNPYQGVVAIFIGNIKYKESISIHGSGEQTRDFIYIDDVVDVWVKSIEEKKTHGQVFNLGSGKDHSINFIVDKVVSEMDSKSVFPTTIYRHDGRQGDISRCVSDSSKLRKALKWKPKVEFNEGLLRFINSVRG